MAELLDYSERRMRRAIAAAPDGVYHGADAVDDDGIGDQPLPVCATVTIAGDSVHVDFAGTSDQVTTNINCPYASTVATALSVRSQIASVRWGLPNVDYKADAINRVLSQ